MDINTINEKVQISRFVKNENILEIVEGDIIVPDIKPDILNLSRVDGNVYITKKEIQDGHLRIDGIIDTYVLYIADNENNQIKGINTILNFSENLDMPELKDGMIVNLTCSLTNIEHKIINGRKISLKCPVEVSVTMIESKLIEVMKGIEDTNDIQKQMQHICFDELVADGNECVSVKENVAVSNGLLPIGEIIKVSTSIEDKDYKISYNKLLAKCELKVCILYIADTEKGELESFETKIPVTGFIDLSGINDQMKFDVNYNIAYLYVKPIYQDLKATAIGVEAEIEFDAIAYNNRTLEVISDLYNPEYEIKYNVETSNIEQKNMITNEKIKVEQMITVPELMNTQLLNVNIKPIITDKHFLDDKLMLNGSIEAEIICYNRNKNNLESRIIEVPYKHSVKLNKKINENN
ncbi:MAG: DUF3794 domain-containing protein, partial [Clostridia bacterium]|nr:DUF3794 domain-containing protein [Clostridia bacterium]